MCGIVGIYNFDGEPVNEVLLQNMAHLMAHRGPDDEGFWTRNGVGLGHQRLSIIDLSPAGHQPMCNEDESIWVIYNGEIYNYIEVRSLLKGKGHIFKSQSDTEVILHAYEEWGKECVHKFNGMFAFSIWDGKQREMFLARDRLGIKPLYYFVDGERLVFASEIKALFQVPGIGISINLKAVLDYLMYQYVLTDETFFKGIRKLLPGHYFSIKKCNYSLKKYWEVPSEIIQFETEKEVKELQYQIRELLEDSIRLRLRSDVDVGCYLSGGIDSSSITCLAAKLSPSQLKTFTGKFSEGPEFDETGYAKIVSDYAKTDYHELNVKLTDVTSMLPQIIWYMDEPDAGPGVIPQYFISKLASQHVKVILGGQGGDELFGGYGWYRKAIFALLLRKPSAAGEIFQTLSAFDFLSLYAKKEGILRVLEGVLRFGLKGNAEAIHHNVRSIMEEKDLKSLIRPEILEAENIDKRERYMAAFDECRSENIVSQFFKFDIKYYLSALLHVEDRTSMAVSLESRLPFLDYRFVELACRIPADLKIGVGDSKYLLRESFKDLIPREIYERKDKKGFPTPIESWFKEKNNGLIQNYLFSKDVGIREILNQDHLTKIWREAQQGKRRAAEKLWRCISVSVWYDNFINNYSRIAKEQLGKIPFIRSKCVS